MPNVNKQMQAFRESSGHAMTTQEGVDPGRDKDEEELPDLDIKPDVDVAAQEAAKAAKHKKLIAAAMAVRAEAPPPQIPEGEPHGYRTGGFPVEEGGPPMDTGEPEETGKGDTGEPADTGSPFDTGDTGGAYEPPTVNAQGVEINEEAVTGQTGHGEGLVDDYDQMHDVLEDYQKTQIYGAAGVPEAEHHAAAKTDRYRDRRERDEVWSGDGPDGRGELYFYDGDPPRGYWLKEDGTWVNVTGMLYPPGWSR